MKKVLAILIFLGTANIYLAAAYSVKKYTATQPVEQPAATAPVESNTFTFINNFGAAVKVFVLTNPNEKPQILTISARSKSQGVINAECIYYVKVTSGTLAIELIPGFASSDGLPESYMHSDKNKLCVTSRFQIKKSSDGGMALAPVYV